MNYNKIFTTFFGVGTIKKAPGTFGSMAGVFFWLLVNKLLNINYASGLHRANWFWLAFLLVITIYAFDAIKKYGSQVKEIDHKSIVIDEVVGVIIALQIAIQAIHFNVATSYIVQFFIAILLSFCLFRFFDITKPSLIGWCDKNLKNSFGVMLDDILAGFLAGIVSYVFIIIFYKIV
jgi:phosphatidylglycerophosphatase A